MMRNDPLSFHTLEYWLTSVAPKGKVLVIRDRLMSCVVDQLVADLRQLSQHLCVKTLYLNLHPSELHLHNPEFCNPEIIFICTLALNEKHVDLFHKFIQQCEYTRIPTIVIDDPIRQIPPQLVEQFIPLYFRAVNTDYSLIKNRNSILKKILLHGSLFELNDPFGTKVHFEKDQQSVIYLENCNFEEDETFFQIPGGEIFFAPVPYTAEGVIIQIYKEKELRIDIEKGYAHFSSGPYKNRIVPLAEFGIGTNPSHPQFRFISSYEKKWGTCHFGFGYNKNMNGLFDENYHFDIVMDQYELRIDRQKIDMTEVSHVQ